MINCSVLNSIKSGKAITYIQKLTLFLAVERTRVNLPEAYSESFEHLQVHKAMQGSISKNTLYINDSFILHNTDQ